MGERDRPAKNPGGMVCERCSEVFIGEEWHTMCMLCMNEVAATLAKEQRAGHAEEPEK